MFDETEVHFLCGDIKALHEVIALECGESIDFIDGGEDKLESLVYSACGGMGSIEFYISPYKKASALVYYLANNHCFVNCNKRLAFTIAKVFLGYYYDLPARVLKKKDQKYLNDLVVINSEFKPKEDIINELTDFIREAK